MAAPRMSDFEDPIVRRSVAEQVAQRILGLVKSGSLKPGDQLPPERELAASLQVSRPSVREAIRGLTILGVIRTRQGGGAFVSDLDADVLLEPLHFFISLEESNLNELYDARMLIESDVARRAAENITDEHLAKLEEIVAAQAGHLDNPPRFRESDSAFHDVLWKSCGNAFLTRIGKSLNVIGLEFRRMASETAGVLAQSHKDHQRILAALKMRDGAAAAEAASAHMRNVYRTTVESWQKERS
ncbi:FadR/GntR family transcriptional regulator [Arvimicrobium flavum]|uniref:FadR/GntR family transcriptional regulator n=1 Tax=Arvimicrobium flavum TaxID=3393320 RepID=UPI00237BC4D7|nr:FadR/GntR family transcriptional regulator [Mesorhizobium shangrilense]